jgi:hypothetical protein
MAMMADGWRTTPSTTTTSLSLRQEWGINTYGALARVLGTLELA